MGPAHSSGIITEGSTGMSAPLCPIIRSSGRRIHLFGASSTSCLASQALVPISASDEKGTPARDQKQKCTNCPHRGRWAAAGLQRSLAPPDPGQIWTIDLEVKSLKSLHKPRDKQDLQSRIRIQLLPSNGRWRVERPQATETNMNITLGTRVGGKTCTDGSHQSAGEARGFRLLSFLWKIVWQRTAVLQLNTEVSHYKHQVFTACALLCCT